jgi:hypothetical protein
MALNKSNYMQGWLPRPASILPPSPAGSNAIPQNIQSLITNEKAGNFSPNSTQSTTPAGAQLQSALTPAPAAAVPQQLMGTQMGNNLALPQQQSMIAMYPQLAAGLNPNQTQAAPTAAQSSSYSALASTLQGSGPLINNSTQNASGQTPQDVLNLSQQMNEWGLTGGADMHPYGAGKPGAMWWEKLLGRPNG